MPYLVVNATFEHPRFGAFSRPFGPIPSGHEAAFQDKLRLATSIRMMKVTRVVIEELAPASNLDPGPALDDQLAILERNPPENE